MMRTLGKEVPPWQPVLLGSETWGNGIEVLRKQAAVLSDEVSLSR